jgi:nucleoside-diphosphate-sugar epimerase
MGKRKILITGAAGNIGGKLQIALMNEYDLILLDKDPKDTDDIICANLKDYNSQWVKHFENVDSAIHLAGNPHANATWDELIPDNIDSVLNVCGACVEKRVKRLIFASSCHTMGGYREKNEERITVDMESLPDSDYGISKVIGERICKNISNRYPLSVICLRIGWVPRGDVKPDMGTSSWKKSLWLSDRDLIQIIRRSIEATEIKFQILYAVSNNKNMKWDLKTTVKTLNYKPQDGI